MATSNKEGVKHTHSFSDFSGANTQAVPQSIGDNEFAWLENVAPIGHGNLIAMNGPSGVLATWSPDIAYSFQDINFNGVDYQFVFVASGAAYKVNLTNNAVTKFANAGTFSGYGTAICQWQNATACIIDPTKGYFTYDGTTLSKWNGTIQSITVNSPGTGYTGAAPTLTIAASGGVTATATIELVVSNAVLAAGGTSYRIGDILNMSGGTIGGLGQNVTFTVTAVTSGAISGFNISNSGDYLVAPANPVSVTGGTGAGATFTVYWGLGNPVISNSGSGYTTNPLVSIGNAVTGATCTSAVPVNEFPTGNAYAVNDILTVVGGTGTATQIKVTGVGTSYYSFNYKFHIPYQTITSVTIQTVGSYTVLPTSPVSVTGGTGSGATFNLGFSGPGTNFSAAVLTANLSVVPPYGTAIASYSGRIWVANNRTILYSAPGSEVDFTSANAGGSFILSDETLHSSIQSLVPANGYLYIFGSTSIDIISGVQVANGITAFSEVNISASIGTTQILSIVPFYRAIAFATTYGIYLLSGTTPQKISDHLDGVFPLINFTYPISAGQVVINEVICLAFMFNYQDPVLGNRALIAVLFNKKWFFISQGNNLAFMSTALLNGAPTLLATDGYNLYQLLSNTVSKITQTIKTKLWDMGDSTRDKQVIKVGLETITPNGSNNVVGTVITEIANNVALFNPIPSTQISWINNYNSVVSWQNNTPSVVLWVGTSPYNFYKADAETTGKYIGINLTGYAPQQIYTAMHLEYELRAKWTTMPT